MVARRRPIGGGVAHRRSVGGVEGEAGRLPAVGGRPTVRPGTGGAAAAGWTVGNRRVVGLVDCGEVVVFGEVGDCGGLGGGRLAEAGQFGANASVARFAAHGGPVRALGGDNVAGPPSGVAQHQVGPNVIRLKADGLHGGVLRRRPEAAGAEGLGQGDAAPPVGRRGADGLAGGGDGLLMTGEAAQGLAGHAVCPRRVTGKRRGAAHGVQGGGSIAPVEQGGGEPAPDFGNVGMGVGRAPQQGHGFASPTGGTQLGCSIEYVSDRFDHRCVLPRAGPGNSGKSGSGRTERRH